MTTPDQLAEFEPFENLTPAQRVAVAELTREVSFTSGTRLFEEGEPAEGCWLILSGRVSLENHIPGRGQVVVQTLDAGDVLGWSWLVLPHQWHLSALVNEPVRAIEVDTTRLRAMAERDPAFGYQLMLGMFKVVLMRLQNVQARLLGLYGSPRER